MGPGQGGNADATAGGAPASGSGGAAGEAPTTAGSGGAAAGGPSAAFGKLADGWASVPAPGTTEATTGGAQADAEHTYTVTNRNELVMALYPDAKISASGAFASASGPDPTPKIIYVKGTISLNTNAAGVEQTEADYACAGYSFDSYKTAYDPKTWNKQPLVNNRPPALSDCPQTQEALRKCSAKRQAEVIRIQVGSNTSLFGLGSDAKLIHGSLLVGTAVPEPTNCSVAGGGAAGTNAGGAAGMNAGGAAGMNAGGAAGMNAGSGGLPAVGSGGTVSVGVGGGAVASGGQAGSAGAGGTPPATRNVVIRNIAFEDAFDFFPAWTPTDSYTTPPMAAVATGLDPKCQATYDEATDNGPHRCTGGRWNAEYDAISITSATHVWVDHCTFDDGEREDHLYPSVWQAPYVGQNYLVQHHDGLVDVTLAADFVTLSYNRFRNHDKTNLIGGTDRATPETGFGKLSVTLHHNHWESAGQRLPRVRFGKVHSYNNLVSGQLLPRIVVPADLAKVPGKNPLTYAMGIGYLAKLYSESNVFEIEAHPGDPVVDESAAYYLWHKAAPTTGAGLDVNERTYFFDSGSLLNGQTVNLLAHAQAAALASTPPKPDLLSTDTVWKPSTSYTYEVQPASEVKASVMANAGAGKL